MAEFVYITYICVYYSTVLNHFGVRLYKMAATTGTSLQRHLES